MLKTSVARPGSPLVIVHTVSKTRKASTDRITMATSSTGRSSGSVTFRKTCHALAPSTRAASWGSRGMVCSPARRIST